MNQSPYLAEAARCLAQVRQNSLSKAEKQKITQQLAAALWQEARRIETRAERKRRLELGRMICDTEGKRFTIRMADRCFRSRSPKRVAEQIAYLLKTSGTPRFLSWGKKLGFIAFHYFWKLFPTIFVAMIKAMIRKEAAPMIGDESQYALHQRLRQRRNEGMRINLNHVGEAILGEEEACRRLEKYLQDLADPHIECISIKISSIFSQINLLGWEESLQKLEFRLKQIYRAAKMHLYSLPDGSKIPKLVTLDMEEYRDLHLTMKLFKRTLECAEFYDYTAGIVLQSYLPDAFLIQQALTTWAMQRVAYGGAPIRIRLVKGANLAMEKLEAALRGWSQAPFPSKALTDANFMRMLHYGTDPERIKAALVSVGSHNLFDIAYALVLREQHQLGASLSFEMLEGMADPLRRALQSLTGPLLLYYPVTSTADFQNAFAYLIRRLDENSAQGNFLRAQFTLSSGSAEWTAQFVQFCNSNADTVSLPSQPRRQQNRLHPPPAQEEVNNEPDTDWTLVQNRHWAETLLSSLADPSCPGYPRFQYTPPGIEELEIVLKNGVEGFISWSAKPVAERMHLLTQAASAMRAARGQLISAMVVNCAKIATEADTEVSEAIDFLLYYREQLRKLETLKDIRFSPKGVVAVLPPWNFPCSIPTSGIAAALAAGNSVIFKPAPEAVLVGWTLANIFWKAGIPKQTLQFFPCRDEPVGSLLVKDMRIAAVVLTGGTATAQLLLRMRPDLDLMAETGGKNALIVTSMADRDLAVRDIVHSAFGYAGQKCSACSLAILEQEVYEDQTFRKQLKDAAASLQIGSAWNGATRLNPLIRPPEPHLLRALTQLEEGEEWLLRPKQDAKQPNLWSPGIKLGVKKGSFMHQTELFGPVLGVMCAKNLEEALALANSTPYGLTSGIHTLDEREQQQWQQQIVAGNCYINRTITGAIVGRQPFGGCKASSFGKGAKAGGPNYLLQLMHAEQARVPDTAQFTEKQTFSAVPEVLVTPEEVELWQASLKSYAYYWKHYFSQRKDLSQIHGQHNYFTYTPQLDLLVRVSPSQKPLDFLRAAAAAQICRTHTMFSLSAEQYALIVQCGLHSAARLLIESEEELLKRVQAPMQAPVQAGKVKRVRWLSTPSRAAQAVLAENSCNSIIAPVLANGRLELLNYLREVSISIDYHRYGHT
jgi:RHH-type transcriptional regulator, proline utilization regulon repressor / proline dehydrogenase / delta 1-pyrroline-5-carboxylate dehydrogenase